MGLDLLSSKKNGILRRFVAALAFALATSFRANGVLLLGFLVWDALWKPSLRLEARSTFRLAVDLLTVLLFCAMTFFPFGFFQIWAFTRLCPGRPWCNAPVPLAYSFIQSHYWSVGLFRYWTLAQLPNFVLAAPLLCLGVWGLYRYMATAPSLATVLLAPWRGTIRSAEPIARLELAYVLHSAALLALLLFASHVQIVLRLGSPGGLPMLWWAAAALYKRRPRVLVANLVLYNVVGSLLYSGFYPPA